MNIVFIFNADDPKFGGYYGTPILLRFLSSNILQNSSRHLRILIGDLIIHMKDNRDNRKKLYKDVFSHSGIRSFKINKVDEFAAKTNLYLCLLRKITKETIEILDKDLNTDSSYVGFQEIDLTHPPHFVYFYYYLIDHLRLHGKKCSVFYSMSEEDSKDKGLAEELRTIGLDVELEDIGARKTIFNKYEDPPYFKRMRDYQEAIGPLLKGGIEEVEDISSYLEDIHPLLFDTLASSVRTLEKAETTEDIAQAALSGRRFIEKLSNTLFPAIETKEGERKLDKPAYKNRLWAYIENTLKKAGTYTEDKLSELGKEVDRLDSFFNKGLHSTLTKEEVFQGLIDLSILTLNIIQISPSESRRPYAPYQEEMDTFFKEISAVN